MKIYRKGIHRSCTEQKYKDIFKGQGYEIVEEVIKETEEIELTKKDICKLLDEKGIDYNNRDRKEILLNLLSEV